ncbi:hypothetical protein Tco_1183126 [Tanacetum coccineum]
MKIMASSLSNHDAVSTPSLDTKHTIELTDGKLVGADTIVKGCTLKLLNFPFNINLMLIELGSLDVIIRMDWLTKYYTVIICDENLVRVPFDNGTLTIRGDRKEDRCDSRTEKKSEKKRLEDVPIFRDFLDLVPEDLPGFPSTRQVKF